MVYGTQLFSLKSTHLRNICMVLLMHKAIHDLLCQNIGILFQCGGCLNYQIGVLTISIS
jgi:hypothetical protein